VLLDWQMPGIDGLDTARRIAALTPGATPHFVMVTAYGREELVKGAAEVGIQNVLVKPVSPSVLFDAMMRVAGQQTTSTRLPRELPGDAGFNAIRPLRGARILLAEDNELNQQVAVELLRDAGFVVDVAEDGRQALDALAKASWAATPYDAILMDMQMPIMDGVTATVEIRKSRRNADLPIIAMTANAMQADRDRCARAGMNDFVAKPIEPEELWRALAKWIRPRPGLPDARVPVVDDEPAVSRPAPLDAVDEVNLQDIRGLDTALGLQRVMHKRPLYLRLLRLFASGTEGIAQEVKQALDDDDWVTALRLAHTLKGVAGNIGASDLQAHAAELENALDTRASREAIDMLLNTAGRLQTELVEAIRARLDTSAAVVKPPVTNLQLQSICRQLARLLRADDAAAGDLLDKHGALLESAFGSGYSAVDRGVREFEFEVALAALEQCAERTGLALT
jgi:two-component system sensor histidine kinase/response regulator